MCGFHVRNFLSYKRVLILGIVAHIDPVFLLLGDTERYERQVLAEVTNRYNNLSYSQSMNEQQKVSNVFAGLVALSYLIMYFKLCHNGWNTPTMCLHDLPVILKSATWCCKCWFSVYFCFAICSKFVQFLSLQNAIKFILAGRGNTAPYIIFGPPGTGKVSVTECDFHLFKKCLHIRLKLFGWAE